MTIKKDLETALLDAMRARDETRKRTLRMVLAGLKLMEVDKGGPLDEQAINNLLQKEIKMRQETILDAEKGGRADLIIEARDEMQVLEGFLPKQLSEDELRIMIQNAIVDAQATSPTDMGKVMKIVLPKIQGRAPNDLVSRTVREFLLK
jgi:uncharacterized protein